MSTEKEEVADILCEFFEVIVHNIIHAKKLYPETIFVLKRKYGIPVHQSIHPEVNEYINNSLKAIRFHAKKNQLRKLFVCLQSGETILEKYVFDVIRLKNLVESDPFLVNLEQSMRSTILKLNTSQAYLRDLSVDATFSIRIETTTYSSVEFNQEPGFEDFPWTELKEKENNLSSADIVPLHTLDTNFLAVQIYVERDNN